jgi:hypothetical protein
MADLRPYPHTGDESGVEPEGKSATRTRRWGKMILKVFLAVLVLAPILIHLILMGGPSRHSP